MGETTDQTTSLNSNEPKQISFSEFVRLHQVQLERAKWDQSQWKTLYDLITSPVNQQRASAKLNLQRNSERSNCGWTLRAKEEIEKSEMFLFEHICQCNPEEKIRSELQASPEFEEFLWDTFDLEFQLPSPLNERNRTSRQIELVRQSAKVPYQLVIQALVKSSWDTVDALILLSQEDRSWVGEIPPEDRVVIGQQFFWSNHQDGHDCFVNLNVILPSASITKKQIKCSITKKQIEVKIDDQILLQKTLSQNIDVDGSTWYLEGSTLLVTLALPNSILCTKLFEDETETERHQKDYLPLSQQERINAILSAIRTYYAQSYAVAQMNQQTQQWEQALVWFLLDKMGSAINWKPTGDPSTNCDCQVFFYLPTNESFCVVTAKEKLAPGVWLSCPRTSKTMASSV